MLRLDITERFKEKAASILNTSVSNILAFECINTRLANMRWAKKIQRIEPNIFVHRLHDFDGFSCHEGMTICETKHKNPIRFIRLQRPCLYYSDTDVIFFVLKGDLFRIIKFARRYYDKYDNIIPPIIEKDKLQDILNNTVGFYKKRKRFQQYGVNITKGLLFQGSPGNGKSLMSHYIANQMQLTPNRITSEMLQKNPQKCLDGILNILDDIDIAFLSRKNNSTLCCTLLSALDNGWQSDVTIRIITTNEDVRDIIDPAFFRPGRIDRTFYFDNPTRPQRFQFIDLWKIDIDKYVEYILDHTEEFSFAEMQGVYTNLVTQKEIEEVERLDVGKAINHIIENRDKIKKDDHMGFQES